MGWIPINPKNNITRNCCSNPQTIPTLYDPLGAVFPRIINKSIRYRLRVNVVKTKERNSCQIVNEMEYLSIRP